MPPESTSVTSKDTTSLQSTNGSNYELKSRENRYAYVTFFWQGVGSLFPWNAFITSSFYFRTRFCDTPYGHNFET